MSYMSLKLYFPPFSFFPSPFPSPIYKMSTERRGTAGRGGVRPFPPGAEGEEREGPK